jgi:hypothetical protein
MVNIFLSIAKEGGESLTAFLEIADRYALIDCSHFERSLLSERSLISCSFIVHSSREAAPAGKTKQFPQNGTVGCRKNEQE